MKKFKSKKFLDNKAQSGTVFRLLIDGIIGLVIFGLIISSMTYFQSLRISTSINEFYSLINSAKESPNGKVFYSENMLIFLEGTGFTSTNLRDVTGLSDECFTFYSNLAFGKVMAEGKMIDMQQNVEARVYVKCYPSDEVCIYGSDDYEDCCDILCDISFGKKLEDEEIDYDTNPKKDCVPDCKNKECGSDGCEGFCGSCPVNQTCQLGKCISKTTDCNPCPSASSVACGQAITIDNPCSTCTGKGTKCDSGKTCQNDVCVDSSTCGAGGYMFVNISSGPSSLNYPVTYSENPPTDLLTNSDYKTKIIVLRKLFPCTFTMGSPLGEPGRDNPENCGNSNWDEEQRSVTLTKEFYVGVFEITQKQYELVMGVNKSVPLQTGDTKPANVVKFNEAKNFVSNVSNKANLTIDLPTEAQWEYACRAGTTTGLNTPPNGAQCGSNDNGCECADNDPNLAIVSSRYFVLDKIQPVGSKLANNWGLYDMHGNVGEWTLDWFSETTPQGGTNPTGASTGLHKVLRGDPGIGAGGNRCADRSIDVHEGYEYEYADRDIAGPGFRIISKD